MLFKHQLNGRPVHLVIADEDDVYRLTTLVNLSRSLYRRADLSSEELAAMLRTHNIVYATTDNEVIGVVIFRPGDEIEVDWLCVSPDFRRKRVATFLLRSISTGLSGRVRSLLAELPDRAEEAILLFKRASLTSRMDSEDDSVYVFSGHPKWSF